MSQPVHEPTTGAMALANQYALDLAEAAYVLSQWPEGTPGREARIVQARRDINRIIELFEPSRAEVRHAA